MLTSHKQPIIVVLCVFVYLDVIRCCYVMCNVKIVVFQLICVCLFICYSTSVVSQLVVHLLAFHYHCRSPDFLYDSCLVMIYVYVRAHMNMFSDSRNNIDNFLTYVHKSMQSLKCLCECLMQTLRARVCLCIICGKLAFKFSSILFFFFS